MWCHFAEICYLSQSYPNQVYDYDHTSNNNMFMSANRLEVFMQLSNGNDFNNQDVNKKIDNNHHFQNNDYIKNDIFNIGDLYQIDDKIDYSNNITYLDNIFGNSLLNLDEKNNDQKFNYYDEKSPSSVVFVNNFDDVDSNYQLINNLLKI